MSLSSSTTTGNSLIEAMINELERRGLPPEMLTRAKEILSDDEAKEKIREVAKIDKAKIEKATEIKSKIDSLTNEIVSRRYQVNEESKIIGKKLFEDNSETGRISHELKGRQVTDQDTLHLFIDDLHKYIIQSANWGDLYKNTHISPTLKIIESYRNSFDHIYDLRGGGAGSEKAYKNLGKINEELLGHRVIKVEEYPFLQIEILDRVKKMLILIEDNIEDWLK